MVKWTHVDRHSFIIHSFIRECHCRSRFLDVPLRLPVLCASLCWHPTLEGRRSFSNVRSQDHFDRPGLFFHFSVNQQCWLGCWLEAHGNAQGRISTTDMTAELWQRYKILNNFPIYILRAIERIVYTVVINLLNVCGVLQSVIWPPHSIGLRQDFEFVRFLPSVLSRIIISFRSLLLRRVVGKQFNGLWSCCRCQCLDIGRHVRLGGQRWRQVDCMKSLTLVKVVGGIVSKRLC